MTAAFIRDAKFHQVLRGYRIDDVDRFLEDLDTRIDKDGKLSSGDVSNITFARGLRGYAVRDVDAYLESLARTIAPG